MSEDDTFLGDRPAIPRARRRHKAALVPWLVNAMESHRKAAKISRAKTRNRFADALNQAMHEHWQGELGGRDERKLNQEGGKP